jgi:tetratricopeptide (TPR) repeat protein
VVEDVDTAELERYLRIYQENPDSRVFAPLADLYRRLGRLEEAENVCREGIGRHPYYAGGRVAYAHILLDKGLWDEALTEIEAVVNFYPDNLLARKIFIRVLCALEQRSRAQKEWDALQALAPDVAADPQLTEALQGPSTMSLKDTKTLAKLQREKLILEALLRDLA